ncbi:MAG: hypothetical protein IJ952_05150, partial [Alistipes sp.]|nr:hypothetical protein [Alistipes sp.]
QQQDPNKDQQQNQDQNKDGGGDDKQDEQEDKKPNEQPQNRSGMSEEQQKQLLDAIQAQEDKTQDKLDKKAKGIIVKGRKNW